MGRPSFPRRSNSESCKVAGCYRTLGMDADRNLVGSASTLGILREGRDLLPVAKRAFMDSENDRSLGGSKAGGRNTWDGNRMLRQAEDEGVASTLSGAVWRRDEIFESGASVSADRGACRRKQKEI